MAFLRGKHIGKRSGCIIDGSCETNGMEPFTQNRNFLNETEVDIRLKNAVPDFMRSLIGQIKRQKGKIDDSQPPLSKHQNWIKKHFPF
jgi:hypothetical protein